MGSLLTKSLTYCGPYNVGGITELYFANKDYVTDYFFSSSDTNLNTVTNLTVSPLIDWYHYTVIAQTAIAGEKMSKTSGGKLYTKSFDLTIQQMSSDKRDNIVELLDSETVIVYKDYNSKWFIMGLDFGCRVTSYEATSDKLPGINQYKINLDTTEKTPLRSITDNYVSTNILTASGGGECYFFVDDTTFDASLFYSTLLYTVEDCPVIN
jgi:hypothetical protein